jgi:hypothetical protein
MFRIIGKIRGDDFPDDDVVITKPVETEQRAIEHVSVLTESFHDLQVVEIIHEFSDAAAAKNYESPKTATNTGSTSCRGCANAIDDCANGDNFVCKECSRFYTSKWVA